MVETVIKGLIGIAAAVLCVVLVIWFLGQLGIVLPAMVVKIFYLIAVLLVILWLYRLLKSAGVGWLP
jgi:hypothetical protein